MTNIHQSWMFPFGANSWLTFVYTLHRFGHFVFIVDRIVFPVQTFANDVQTVQRMHDIYPRKLSALDL
jgi:hypothetical protein